MPRIKFTTSMDSELIKRIKVQAITENRSVADIIEELITKYLDRVESK